MSDQSSIINQQSAMPAKLAITVCATKSYLYAMKSQCRRIVANIQGLEPGLVVFVGDDSKQCKDMAKFWQDEFPEDWKHRYIAVDQKSAGEHPNYKPSAQLVLARLRGLAFSTARQWGADLCWSLDSDVLPPANALACMRQMLEFDGGFYGVSTCSYPNDAFLGGFGTQQNPISPNAYPDEVQLPDPVAAARELLAEFAVDPANPPAPGNPKRALRPATTAPELKHRRERLDGWIIRKNYPPKGNVFQLNAEGGWRPRGWFEHAYPGIGRGSVVPVDWCGFGCTLMGKRALSLATFEGYDGAGTEDLWVCWKHWHPDGIRINCISHVVCDHVIHQKKKGGADGEYVHLRAFHEPQGACAGHLRTEKRPWLYD